MKNPFNKEAFLVPLFLLFAIWITYFMQLSGLGEYECYGIVPRNNSTLRGIFLSPFFHNTISFKHIVNNSVPLAVLCFFTFLVYRKIAYWVFILGWIFTGLFVWLLGDVPVFGNYRSGCHIGASGIVYMLASFLFFSGIFRRSVNTIAVALIVAFLYGSMIWGIFPEEIIKYSENQGRISWESHLMGLLVGFFLAYIFRKLGPKKMAYPWQKQESYTNPYDELLWQQYLESLPEGEEPKTFEEIVKEQKSQKKKWDDLL